MMGDQSSSFYWAGAILADHPREGEVEGKVLVLERRSP